MDLVFLSIANLAGLKQIDVYIMQYYPYGLWISLAT